ncbi:hypothetical protein Ciccas_002972 [Cichlidogyrus casuarinus]|uniref:Uncharacterized protein n=1 Tax=Cichlidogyrus casuarinus TaxID=1844966 RepID=A0ABD2QFQ4_9PLAT
MRIRLLLCVVGLLDLCSGLYYYYPTPLQHYLRKRGFANFTLHMRNILMDELGVKSGDGPREPLIQITSLPSSEQRDISTLQQAAEHRDSQDDVLGELLLGSTSKSQLACPGSSRNLVANYEYTAPSCLALNMPFSPSSVRDDITHSLEGAAIPLKFDLSKEFEIVSGEKVLESATLLVEVSKQNVCRIHIIIVSLCQPKQSRIVTKNVLTLIRHDKHDFYLTLPPTPAFVI